jgi:hypothetical protein
MRQALALVFILVPALAAAQSSDPAYVDSPQSKAVPDPARADRRSGTAQALAAQEASMQQAEMAREDAERIAEVERTMREQVEKLTAAHAAQRRAQQDAMADTGPPIGGRSLLDETWHDPMRADAGSMQASPARQIGSALLQDVGGVIDARVEREIHGDEGPVYFPASGP